MNFFDATKKLVSAAQAVRTEELEREQEQSGQVQKRCPVCGSEQTVFNDCDKSGIPYYGEKPESVTVRRCPVGRFNCQQAPLSTSEATLLRCAKWMEEFSPPPAI